MKTKTVVIAGLVIVGAVLAYKMYQKNQNKVSVDVKVKGEAAAAESKEEAESESEALGFAGGGRKGGGKHVPMQNDNTGLVYTKRHK